MGGGALDGRVVIVTGAARGLGRAYVARLLAEGAAVVANDLDAAELAEQAAGARVLAAIPGDAAAADTAGALSAPRCRSSAAWTPSSPTPGCCARAPC